MVWYFIKQKVLRVVDYFHHFLEMLKFWSMFLTSNLVNWIRIYITTNPVSKPLSKVLQKPRFSALFIRWIWLRRTSVNWFLKRGANSLKNSHFLLIVNVSAPAFGMKPCTRYVCKKFVKKVHGNSVTSYLIIRDGKN